MSNFYKVKHTRLNQDAIWEQLDKAEQELRRELSKLQMYKNNLHKKVKAIGDFEDVLSQYRDDLLSDAKYEDSYIAHVSRYHDYVSYITDIRRGWRGMEIPSGPSKLEAPAYSGETTREEFEKHAKPVIAKFNKSVPLIPGNLEKPARTIAPDVKIPIPGALLSNTSIQMSDSHTVTVGEIESILADQENGSLFGKDGKDKFGLSIGDYSRAREYVLRHIGSITDDAIRQSEQDQKNFAEWVDRDIGKAIQYAGDLDRLEDSLIRSREQLSEFEKLADQHWDYLEGRYHMLNEGNLILEARRVAIQNGMTEWPEWQQLQEYKALGGPAEKIVSNDNDAATRSRALTFEEQQVMEGHGKLVVSKKDTFNPGVS